MSKKLNEYDWLLLSKLINRYGNESQALDVFEKMNKSERVTQIKNALADGQFIKDVLIKDSFEKQIGSYTNFLPLDKAIDVVYQRKRQYSQIIKDITNNVAYSLVLLISSLAVLLLFTNLVIPNMLASLSLKEDEQSLVSQFRVFNIFKDVFIIALLIIILFMAFIKITKREKYLWVFLHKYNLDNLFKVIATYQFVNDLKILLDNGISLDEAINIIRFTSGSLAGLLAYHFDNSLNSGDDFEDSLQNEFFDDEFYTICLFGLKNNDFDRSLDDYKEIIEMKIKNMIKISSGIVQTICYIFVAIVIILAYQALLMPLDLISQL